jgi:hypothetical protein
MNTSKPILIADTSALNRLTDDPDSAHLVSGCKAGFFIRLTADNLREIAAIQTGPRREQLLALLRQLLPAGEFALPYNWILEGHIRRFHENRNHYDWKAGLVRFPHAEMEVFYQEFLNDQVAREELQDARENEIAFKSMFGDVRPDFQALFENGEEERPASVKEFVDVLQVRGGAFWSYGQSLFTKITGVNVDEATIRDFIRRCPPFNAVLIALCTAQYERCIRNLSKGPSLRAGRLDMYVAAHLPYCNRFLTADIRQLNALREVATVGGFLTEVLHFDDLRDSMMPGTLATTTASVSFKG